MQSLAAALPLTFELAGQVGAQALDRLLNAVPGLHRSRPWMKRRETALVVELLRRLAPRRCLEWGAGYSTLYFPRFMAPGGSWLSIEHDEAWGARVRSLCRDPRVRVEVVPPDRVPWSGPCNDGTAEEFRTYVGRPEADGPFDFVLVDGRARTACVDAALRMLAPAGAVLLHDAHREIYRDAGATYRHRESFTDYRREIGGIWIGRSDAPVSEILDTARQRALWSLARDLGRTPFGRLLRV